LEDAYLILQTLAIGTRLVGFAVHARSFYDAAARMALPP
jgi:hypothetical protein